MTTLSPQQSVKDALTDLQLKTRLLEEERDYYLHLQTSSAKSFADHRRELEGLLSKERSYAAAQEERMEALLQRLLHENSLMGSQIDESKRRGANRLREAVEDYQSEAQSREARLRAEADRMRNEAHAAAEESRRKAEELASLRNEVDGMKMKQTQFQHEVQQLTDDNQVLTRQLDKQRLLRERAAAAARQRRVKQIPGGYKAAFIPSGATQRDSVGIPATSNVHAIVQTIRGRNVRSPKRSHSEPRNASGSHLDDICRSLIAELLDLRAEYDGICRAMSSPQADSASLSARLRQVFTAMDQKMLQLRNLRQSQNRIDDEQRLHDLMVEVAEDNNHCTQTLDELVKVMRQPM